MFRIFSIGIRSTSKSIGSAFLIFIPLIIYYIAILKGGKSIGEIWYLPEVSFISFYYYLGFSTHAYSYYSHNNEERKEDGKGVIILGSIGIALTSIILYLAIVETYIDKSKISQAFMGVQYLNFLFALGCYLPMKGFLEGRTLYHEN